MPIALYPELTKTWTKIGASLSPWERLTTLEEQLLRRARSAFLVHWFGPGIPERRLSLLIFIDNIAEFRARYALVKRSMPGASPEMNLLLPLAGMAGLAAGMFFSPSGIFLVAPYIHELFELLTDGWWGPPASMMYSLVLNWVMPLLGPGLMIGLGAPLFLAFALGAALSGEQRSRAIVRLLGDSAMLIDAFLEFWRQVSGPEEKIRNPLVRAVVVVLRRFAALFAQVLGFAALLVTRLLPLIPNLIAQFRAALSLGRAVTATLVDIARGFIDSLMTPFTQGRGIRRIFSSIFETFSALLPLMMTHITATLSDMISDLRNAYDFFNQALTRYIAGISDRLASAFKQTPVGRMVNRITALVQLVPRLRRVFRNIPEGAAGEPTDWGAVDENLRGWWNALAGGVVGPGLGERVADLIQTIRGIRLPSPPSLELPPLPSAPRMPDSPALRAEIGLPGPIDFSAEARRLLNNARATQAPVPASLLSRPTSVLAAERARLQALGPPVLSEREIQLRDIIYLAVGRVLPPALRIYAPRLHTLFQRMDTLLYNRPAPTQSAPEELPQLDLSAPVRIRPKVQILTIRSNGGFAPDLRAFRDLVVEAMERQTYLSPNAG